MSQSVEGIVYKVVIDPSTGIAQLKQFDRATLETERNTKKAAAGIEGSIEKASKSTKDLTAKGNSLDSMFEKITPKSLLAAAGISAISASAVLVANSIRQFLDMGQKVQSVSTAFDTLTSSVGLAGKEIIDAMKAGTRGLVDDSDMMRSVNEALIQELPITVKSAREMAEAATRVGRSLGLDAATAIDTFLSGTARMQERQLKSIGISVDQARVFDALAVSLKKPVAELAEAEKRVAFFTAAHEELIRVARRTPEVVDTLSDVITTAGNAFQNTKEEIAVAANNLERWQTLARISPRAMGGASAENLAAIYSAQERQRLGPSMGYEIRPPEPGIPDVAPVPGDWARSKLKIPSAYDTRLMIDALRVAVVETNLLRDAARGAGDTDAFKILTTQLKGLNEQLEEAQKKAGLLREPLAKIQAGPTGLPSVPFVDAITATRGISGTPTDMFSLAASAGVRSQMIAEPAMDMIAGPATAGFMQLRAVLDEARASSAALVAEFQTFQTVVPIAIAEGIPALDELILRQSDLAMRILASAAAGGQFSASMLQQAEAAVQLSAALEGQIGQALTWNDAWTQIRQNIGVAGHAMTQMGGSFGKAGKIVNKAVAGMLLVEGISGVKEGAIKVAKGIYPPQPGFVISGTGMIAAGLAAIAQAKALGASGGGSGGGAPAGGGGGGSSAAPYPTYVGKGGVEAGSGTSQRYANPRETGGTVVNNHFAISTLDTKSLDAYLSDPSVRSKFYEVLANEAK